MVQPRLVSSLRCQLTGQKRFEIFPRTSTDFFFKVVDAQMEGRVTHGIHGQAGGRLEVAKIE
jgi:hypothetical protein